MRRFLRAVVGFIAVAFPLSTACAEIRLVKSKCPFASSAAFKIVGAKGERDGVGIEYRWLALGRPGWERVSQVLIHKAGRHYDILNISKDGATQAICFDITDFFGKNDLF